MDNKTSRWATGTYEMLLETGVEGVELSITIFAKPISLDNPADDDDAPFLAQADVTFAEIGVDGNNLPFALGLREIGEQGLAPEDVETVFGPRMGVRVLLALFNAADRDFRGVDMDAIPWRTPSNEAFQIMTRTHNVMLALKNRLYG